ncbi:hypothetical protein EZM72_24620, partial [Salmonella enterica]|nr:hypothetical protein [Salmonella enterica]
MNIFIYSISDALRWASFCKDYNPIHFFYTSKNRKPIVHGMRVALDIKNHILSNAKTISDAKAYLNVSVKFVNPVYYNCDYMLSPFSVSDRIKLKLIDYDNHNTVIETIVTTCDNHKANAPENSLLINDVCFLKYFKSFLVNFKEIKDELFWDSLLFCVVISSLKDQSIFFDSLGNILMDSTLIHTHQHLIYKKLFIDTFNFYD